MSEGAYIPRPKVWKRYGITAMTLHRWEKDPKVGFPQPIIVNRRKFFLEVELIAWERRRAAGRAVA